MASDLDDLAEPERRLCEVLAAYFEADKAGQAPGRAAWLAEHPDLADELAEFLAQQDRLLSATEPLRSILEAAGIPGPDPGGPALNGDGAALLEAGAPARIIGDYELLGEIDRGGMGVVYRARQRSLNRLVALKMLRSGGLADGDDARRFRLEAEAVAQLDHPNIVPIHEVGEHDGSSYFTMKLIEGTSLARRPPGPAADPRASARIVAIVARAVHHAHQRGILHRDLKPSNILIDAEGQPHVTDFGLAKRVEAESELTRSGEILGTPSYMAPEQASGKIRAITTATDVHGLGAVLYALLTGKPPFRGDSALETLDKVRREPPEPPSGVGRHVDRDLETICLKCLEKESERRYGSALALAEDLEHWLRGEPIAARPVGRLERTWRWCRLNPLVATLIALVLFLLIVGLLGLGQYHLASENLAEARLQRQREAYNFSIMLERAASLVAALNEPRPAEGPDLVALRREMSEKALDLIRIFLKERGSDPTRRIEAVYTHRVLGSLYREIRTRDESYAEFDRAKQLAELLVADYPEVSPYRVELGRIHDILAHHREQDGNPAEADREYRRAEAEFRRAAELDPGNANALNMLAWQLAQDAPPHLRKPVEGIDWARRALAVAKSQEEERIWLTLGLAYYRNGDWRSAVSALEKSCQVRPPTGNDHDYFALAMAHWQLGHKAEARRYYNKAIAWNVERSLKPENAPLYAEATRLLGPPEPGGSRP
jgi:tetratricopeptide (TPR) repeat protein